MTVPSVASGNLLFVWCGGASPPSVSSDSLGSAWTSTDPNDTYAFATRGGSETITFSAACIGVVLQYSNVASYAGLITTGSGTTTSLSVGPITTTAASSLIIAHFSGISGFIPASGYTSAGGPFASGYVEYQTNTPAGPQKATASATSVGGTWYGYVFSFTSMSGTWSTTGDMTASRTNFTATVLDDGEVLLAGGWDTNGIPQSTAELYDPGTGTFTATGNMTAARADQTATLLNNGTVLIAGGYDQNYNPLNTAETYNPATGKFTATQNMTIGHAAHTASLLSNGLVLIAGGYNTSSSTTSTAELYNPETGAFTATGSMQDYYPAYATATLLDSGKVLVVGGIDNSGDVYTSAELYDPSTGVFTATGPMKTARYTHCATLLNGGKVLIAGGYNANFDTLSTSEIYDPIAGTFSPTGTLLNGRGGPTATLLNDGQVLVVGGTSQGTNVGDAELYDPVAGTFSPAETPSTARYVQTATLLPDGTVLVAGGLDNSDNALTSAETFVPSSLVPEGLVSIALSPLAPTLPTGGAQAFVATGTFTDQSTQILASATWSSSDSSLATVTNDATNHGTVFGVAQGAAAINACTGSMCGSTSVTVEPAALVSIAISPQNSTASVPYTQQLTATGTYNNGSTADITSAVTWTSSTPAVAGISSEGLDTPVAQGTTTIQASSGSITGSTTLTVGPPLVTSVVVTPTNAGMITGSSQLFSATVYYSDGTSGPPSLVSWQSYNTSAATVDSTGLVTAVAPGSAQITAFVDGNASSGSASVNVVSGATQPSIVASVSPSPNSSGWNNSTVTVSFTCTAGSANLTSCPAAQAVSSPGAGQDVSGTVTDAAGNSASASVTVNIDESNPTLSVSSPTDDSSISTSDLVVSGSVSDAISGLSTVTCDGSAATVSTGSFSCNLSLNSGVNLVALRATDVAGNVSAANLHITSTVALPAPSSIQITPTNVTMLIGDVQGFTAIDDQHRVRTDVTWSVSDTTITSVLTDVSGELQGIAAGEVTLTATVQGVTAQTTVTVDAGTSLPSGTVRWSVAPVPGYTVQQIIQGNPVQAGDPDLFAIETGNGNNVVQGLTIDGQQIWEAPLSFYSSENVPATADNNGGIVLASGDLGGPIVTDLDGQTGTQLWQYQLSSNNGEIDAPQILQFTVDPKSGLIYFPWSSPSSNGYLWSVIGLDPTTGTEVINQPLQNTATSTTIDYCNGRSGEATGLPAGELANPVIGPDGTLFTVFTNSDTTYTDTCGGSGLSSYTQRLSLMEIPPNGPVSFTQFNAITQNVTTQPVTYYGLIPDGQGGALISWGIPVAPYSMQVTSYITDVSPNGISDAVFPELFGGPQMVLGDNNTAFVTDGCGLTAFNVSGLSQMWTYSTQDCAVPLSGTLSLISSTAGGGVVAKYTANGVDTILRFDASGNLTTDLWSAANVINFGGSYWNGAFGGGTAGYAATPADLSSSSWVNTDGFGGNAAIQTVTVSNFSQEPPNQTTIAGVVNEILDALPNASFPGTASCYAWIQSGPEGVAGTLPDLQTAIGSGSGSAWGHGVENENGSPDYDLDAITVGNPSPPGVPQGILTVVNDDGAFFNTQYYSIENQQYSTYSVYPRGYPGNDILTQAQDSLHEMGHQLYLPPPWQNFDGGNQKAVDANNRLVDKQCGKMIRSLPSINPLSNVPSGLSLGLQPTSGAPGTLVTINGTNFGSAQGTSTVTFNGVSAGAASQWSNTQIKIAAPNGVTSGNVVVTISGIPATGPVFTVN